METSSFNIEQSCDALTQLYAAARAEGKTG